MKNLCTKTPELQTAKLIKPVLKRESEELEQPTTLSNSEVYLRSILKSNLNLRSIQTMNDAATSRSEGGLSGIESQNQNSEIAKFCERLDSSDITTNMTQNSLQCLCDNLRTSLSKESDNIGNKASVPSHKTAMFRNEKLSNDINCKIDTIPSSSVSKRCNDKWHSNLLIVKSNKVSNVHNDNDNYKDDTNDNENNEKDTDIRKQERMIAKQNNDDNHALSSSNDYEVHITENKKYINITQCSNLLAKNINQHSRGDERRRPRQRLERQCRNATQVIASIETSETPSVSIADRLAALRHNGSTSWRQRVADGKINDSFDNPLLSAEENTTIKSGVLADCIEKLESSIESWKSRIVTQDAINFTVAGKMKVVGSKDGSSSFLTETTANISNQKKKALRPQRFKTRKGKDESFFIFERNRKLFKEHLKFIQAIFYQRYKLFFKHLKKISKI